MLSIKYKTRIATIFHLQSQTDINLITQRKIIKNVSYRQSWAALL